jgi:hypothetical protein
MSDRDYRGQAEYTEGDDQEVQRQFEEQERRDQTSPLNSTESAPNDTYDQNWEQGEPRA